MAASDIAMGLAWLGFMGAFVALVIYAPGEDFWDG